MVRLMTDSSKESSVESDLSLALTEIADIGQDTRGVHRKGVSEFMKKFKGFVSESTGEILSAYAAEVCKSVAG